MTSVAIAQQNFIIQIVGGPHVLHDQWFADPHPKSLTSLVCSKSSCCHCASERRQKAEVQGKGFSFNQVVQNHTIISTHLHWVKCSHMALPYCKGSQEVCSLAELPYGKEEENGMWWDSQTLDIEYCTGTRVHCSLYWMNSGDIHQRPALAIQKLWLFFKLQAVTHYWVTKSVQWLKHHFFLEWKTPKQVEQNLQIRVNQSNLCIIKVRTVLWILLSVSLRV